MRSAARRSYLLAPALAVLLLSPPGALGDSSSPRLAGYYDRFMAICDGRGYEWEDEEKPRAVMDGVRAVAVGKSNSYALTRDGKLLGWSDDPSRPTHILDGVDRFKAGRSGLFAIRDDDSLWHIETRGLLGFGETVSDEAGRIADGVATATIGDSANYYVTQDGRLFVKGRAHRGQYGDGRLSETDDYVHTADNVAQLAAHTGHALLLKHDGSVWGTGGNIYGPLGRHGHGDKAVRWGRIFDGATAIATGSSHSVAITASGDLWIWGRNEGLEPRQVIANVSAVAAGSTATVAISGDSLWQWDTGSAPRRVMACPEGS